MPSGSTSWRPMARRACRRVPDPGRAGATPNAAWPTVPHGWAGFVCDLDHLGDQRAGVGVQALRRGAVERVHAEQDRLAESELVDAADVGRAQRPAEVGRVAAGHDREPPLRGGLHLLDQRAAAASIFESSGAMPLWQARLVPIPTSVRDRVALDLLRRASTSDSGATPSRRSPSSTMRTTPWVIRRRRAAAGERLEHGRLGVEADGGVAHHGVDLARHRGADERPREQGAAGAEPSQVLDTGVARARSRLRARTRPRPRARRAPPSSPRRRGCLVGPSRSTSVRALASTLARSTSSRGAVTTGVAAANRSAPGRRRAPSRPARRAAG